MQDREWDGIRRQILKRDGYRCSVFGCSVKGSANLSVHHIIPRPEGGNNPENLITLCHHHHDEIELAHVLTAELIRNWTGPDVTGEEPEIVSSAILDATTGDGRKNMIPNTPQPQKGFICRKSTREALLAMKDGRSLVDVANALHYEPSFATTISSIIAGRAGAVTEEGERELRARLGLESNGHHGPRSHVLLEETIEALRGVAAGKTWRACADALDYPPSSAAALCAAARGETGAMSFQAENILRERLGLPPIKTVPTMVCLSCLTKGRGLIVHAAGDCHDKPVAEVVVLAEGERVVKRAGKPRKRKQYKLLRFDPNNDTELALYNATRAALQTQRKES